MRSRDTEEEGEKRGLNARLREQSALCSEVTRRGVAGEGAQGRRLQRERRNMPLSLRLRGAGTGLRAGLLGGRCRRGVPRPCWPSPEPHTPSPESECYIKSRVRTMRGVAPVAPAQPPSSPAVLDTESGATRLGVVCGGPGLYSVRTVGRGKEGRMWRGSRPSVLRSGGASKDQGLEKNMAGRGPVGRCLQPRPPRVRERSEGSCPLGIVGCWVNFPARSGTALGAVFGT